MTHTMPLYMLQTCMYEKRKRKKKCETKLTTFQLISSQSVQFKPFCIFDFQFNIFVVVAFDVFHLFSFFFCQSIEQNDRTCIVSIGNCNWTWSNPRGKARTQQLKAVTRFYCILYRIAFLHFFLPLSLSLSSLLSFRMVHRNDRIDTQCEKESFVLCV